jgi:probable F420-dependent oxidoreductase
MELTRYGLFFTRATVGEPLYGDAAALAEQLGFGALWLGGSPRLPTLHPMLERTQNLTIATGIVNIWQYDPVELAAEFAELEAEFPGRVLLGIGIGHREATTEYARPLAKTREFFDGLAAAEPPIPRERLVLAALGPKMLELSAERSLGTHPYFTPPAHTRAARQLLGEGALVAPEQAVVINDDATAAAAVARDYASRYLALSNYASNLLRHGYTEADIADGGSERLIDEIIPQGSAQVAAAAANAHLDAGADHVCIQTIGTEGLPEREWTELSAALELSST